jgi:transposase-like protein
MDWTGDTISNICKRYDVSRKTYYKWKNRYEKKGMEGLSDASTRPRNTAIAITNRHGLNILKCNANTRTYRRFAMRHSNDMVQIDILGPFYLHNSSERNYFITK